MDIIEYIEVIKLNNRNIKRSQSFLYNVLGILENKKYMQPAFYIPGTKLEKKIKS